LRLLDVETKGAIDNVPNSDLGFLGVASLYGATAVLLIADVLGVANLERFESWLNLSVVTEGARNCSADPSLCFATIARLDLANPKHRVLIVKLNNERFE
jgi:hypothetical protein